LIIFRNRDFGLLWSGQLLSNLGGWLMVVAVPVYVYDLTGSAVSTGAAFVAETLPALLFAPVAGVFVDRWDRRTVLIVGDLLRGVVILALLVVRSPDLLWLLYLTVLVENTFTQFFQPAHRAIVPSIVGRGKDLEGANAWYTVANGIVRLAGAPIGGALYAILGFGALVLIDSATYLVSVLLLLGLRRRPVPAGETAAPQPALRGVVRDLRAGLAYLLGHRVLRGLMLVSSTFLFANAAVSALLVPYVVRDLGGGARLVGILLSALGLGYLLSAYVGRAMSLSGRLRLSVAGSLLAIAVCFAGFFNWPDAVAATLFIGLAGIPGGALLLLVQVQLQRQTPEPLLGRVSSTFLSTDMAATVCGALAGTLLAGPIGLVPTLNASVALVAVSAALAVILLPSRVSAEPPSVEPPSVERPTSACEEVGA